MNKTISTHSDALPLATVAVTSLGFVVVQLDVNIVNVALARIGTELGAQMSALQWVVDAYTLAFAALLLTGGALGDRFGSRRCFAAGFFLFTLASLACGLAPSIAGLVAARAVQGVGAALLVPSSLALLSHACGRDDRRRARAVGLWTAAGGLALAAGPILGGALVDLIGWRSVFLVNLPVGAAGIWLTLALLDETALGAVAAPLDLPGQTLAILALVGATDAAIEAGARGWADPAVVAGLALGVTAGVGFIAVERRTARPLLPLALFRSAAFSTATAVGFLVNLTVYGLFFVLSLYLQLVLGYEPLHAGIAFVPITAIVILANIGGGRLTAGLGPRLPMAGGLAIGAAGFALLALTVAPAAAYARLLPGMLLIPVGIGIAVPAMTATILSAVERTKSGMASGVLNTVRQVGGATGIALFGAAASGGATALTSGLRAALWAAALFTALAGVICLWTLREKPSP
jgi:DHA2 family methylenomycin A resistance protein-like MFS transporter